MWERGAVPLPCPARQSPVARFGRYACPLWRGISFHLDPVRDVNQAVEKAVGQRGIADLLVPPAKRHVEKLGLWNGSDTALRRSPRNRGFRLPPVPARKCFHALRPTPIPASARGLRFYPDHETRVNRFLPCRHCHAVSPSSNASLAPSSRASSIAGPQAWPGAHGSPTRPPPGPLLRFECFRHGRQAHGKKLLRHRFVQYGWAPSKYSVRGCGRDRTVLSYVMERGQARKQIQ